MKWFTPPMAAGELRMTDPAPEPLLDSGDSRRRKPYLERVLWVSLLLLLVGGGLTVGIPGYRQWSLIREIEKSGGGVRTEFTGPGWLKGLIPYAVSSLTGFERVVAVDQFTDSTLQRLVRHRSLVYLTLNGPQITDTGLGDLKGVTNLQMLWLEDCQSITDAGLAQLKGMTPLQSLFLSGCPNITDAGLKHLKGIENLQYLQLGGCRRVRGAGLEHLKEMKDLQRLDLQYLSNLTDAGLEHLNGMRDLTTLWFRDCPNITDAGLEHLMGMTDLEWIYLNACPRITENGVAKLKKALPKCDVSNH